MRPLFLLAPLLAAGCVQTEPVAANAPDVAAADTTDRPPSIGPVMVGPMMADEAYSAASLVEAMHARYADDWYRTLRFTQTTSRRAPDGTVSEETWREWAALPGRLRIEMGDPLEGPDALFARDSAFYYRDGALVAARPERNPLLVWGFDVYTQAPAETLRILEDEGTDLEAFRRDTWDGRAMYVVGRPETGEVWVEQDRLLFVRLVEPGPDGALQDVRFLDYEPLGDAWIAPRVEVWTGGALVFWEDYADVEAGVPLDPVLFEPRRWAEGVEASK
jgi:hypothetical protein